MIKGESLEEISSRLFTHVKYIFDEYNYSAASEGSFVISVT